MKVKQLKYSLRKVEKSTQDKQLRTRYEKRDYIQMLEEAEKWPLTYRIAAELWRGGVTLDDFENHFHIEGNGVSRLIYEHITRIHLGKGYDPNRITPVRPVYLRYVSPTAHREANPTKGRPSLEKALAFFRQVLQQRINVGWHVEDVIRGFQALEDEVDPPKAPIKIKVNIDEDEMPKSNNKKRLPPIYHVLVGNDWKEAKTQQMALRLREEAHSREKIAPVENPSTHCVWCKFPLAGTSIVQRNEQANTQECMHLGCYWMNVVPQATIPTGMRVLLPPEGCFYVWEGVPEKKGDKMIKGWVRSDPQVSTAGMNHESQQNTQQDSQGVPAPSGQIDQPPKAVPAKTRKGRKVPAVRKKRRR